MNQSGLKGRKSSELADWLYLIRGSRILAA
jgi:hypothetical protein